MSSQETEPTTDIEVPEDFICPLTLEIMNDPVMSRYGNSYERSSILQWLQRGNSHCPLTRQPLSLGDIITNHYLRTKISKWQRANNQDITVIMTPEIPQVCGYFTMPEKDFDETERSEEDAEELTEYPPNRQRSARSLLLGRQRNGSGRFRSSRRSERPQTAGRRLLGIFPCRNAATSASA